MTHGGGSPTWLAGSWLVPPQSSPPRPWLQAPGVAHPPSRQAWHLLARLLASVPLRESSAKNPKTRHVRQHDEEFSGPSRSEESPSAVEAQPAGFDLCEMSVARAIHG